jgi:hypothetical protein
MKKIEKNLEEAIRQNPEKNYRILITTKEGTELNTFKIENAKKLMDNIFSAELKGSKIQSIAEQKAVESIELDSEMSIT